MAKLAWLSCMLTVIAAAAIASTDGDNVKFNVEKYCHHVGNEANYKNCILLTQRYELSQGRDPAVLAYLCCLGFWCNSKQMYTPYADIAYIREITQGINYRFMENVADHLLMCGKGFYQLHADDEMYLCQHYYADPNPCKHEEDDDDCLDRKFKRLSSNDFHYWMDNGKNLEVCEKPKK